MLLGVGIPTVLLIFAIGAFLVFSSVVRQVASGNCLPSDFPRYGGSTTTGINVYHGTGGSSCDMTFNSTASSAQLTDFYTTRLRQGDWTVQSVDPANGTVTFQRRSNPAQQGQIQVYGRGTGSSYEVRFSS
ncbi:MAG: hypothetical protein J2P45_03475 [Candidatus Dormibacteraeota bacterium]|nr:hypothetical protein [Candidatus Dormibacteraeota bacterium]